VHLKKLRCTHSGHAQTLKKGALIAPVTRVKESRNSTGIQIGLLNIRSDAGRFKYLPLTAISLKKRECEPKD
jgi:hypothetical protein